MRFKKDRSGRWMMEYRGNSLVKILRLPPVESIRPVATELVAPRRIPDGLFEVLFQGEDAARPLLVEVESYPDADASRQILEDILLVRLTYQVFPDAVLILLSPRGNQDSPEFVEFKTPGGTVAGVIRWRVIKMWELDAEELFALNDPGLVPWITLTRTKQPPREFLRRCKELLESTPAKERVAELRAVASIFASIRYNETDVADFFSEDQNMMIASPYLDKMFEMLEAKAAASAEAKVAARIENLEKLAEARQAELEALAETRAAELEALAETRAAELAEARAAELAETRAAELAEFRAVALAEALAEARDMALAELRIRDGKLAALREMVIDLLGGRFSGPFEAIESRINQEEDPARLKELVRLASRAESLHDFERQL